MAEPSVIFSHSEHNEPAHDLASPIGMSIPGEDITGKKMFLLKAIGGLTKLEHVAAMILPQCERNYATEGPEKVAIAACTLAEALLAECAKRQAPKAEKPVFEGAAQ